MRAQRLLLVGAVWLVASGVANTEEKRGLPPIPGIPKAEDKAAQPAKKGDAVNDVGEPERDDWAKEMRKGWDDFATFLVLDFIVVLVLATILAAAIAYHPRSYGKAATLEEAEQPKIFLMYSIVGALIGRIVEAKPELALVFFGLGGLFRFRTEVGPAKDTGRVILVTCVGVCCGVKSYVPAVVGTAFAWALIYFLESRVAHRVVVKGIEAALLGKAAEAYEEVLRENGLAVMSEKKNFLKGQVAFVFRAPGELNREQLESMFKDIPPKLQGSPDWESS